jgi:hypothetical protein
MGDLGLKFVLFCPDLGANCLDPVDLLKEPLFVNLFGFFSITTEFLL